MENPQKIDESALSAMLDELLRTSIGAPDGKLAKDRLASWQYYRGEPTGDLAPPEIEGRSRYVSRDVSQTVDWILPSLIEVFTSSDEAVVFEGQGPEDEAGAKQATEWVNYVFYRQNNGLLNLHHWFKDALIGRLGIIKVWWDDSKDVTTETYRGLSEDEVMLLTQDPALEISGRGEPYDNGQGVMVFDIEVKRTKDASKICIDPVPPEEFYYSNYARSPSDCPFMAHVTPIKASELRAAGYPNVEEAIQSYGEPWNNASVETSYRRSQNSSVAYGAHADTNSMDESMREIWVAECYLMVDFNGDGIAEWRKVLKSGNVILENVEIDNHPFCLVTPDPNPHELAGNSIADKVMDIQEIKTALVRGILDNTYLTNNQRYLFNTNAELDIDALLDNRPLGIVGTDDMTAVKPLITPPLAPQTFNLLEYVQGDAENRTGVTRYNQGLDGNSLNKTATGVNAIMTASQQRIKLISRIFAETGVRDLFKKILHLTTKYDNKARIVRLTNGWTPIDPQAWSNGYDIKINVGIGTGNKDQMAAHLTNVLQIQKEALAIGVSTPSNIYKAAKKLVENMGFKNGDDFFTDPAKTAPEQPQPPQPDPAAMAKALNDKAKIDLDSKKALGELGLRARELDLKEKEAAADMLRSYVEILRSNAIHARDEQQMIAVNAIIERQMEDALKVVAPIAESILQGHEMIAGAMTQGNALNAQMLADAASGSVARGHQVIADAMAQSGGMADPMNGQDEPSAQPNALANEQSQIPEALRMAMNDEEGNTLANPT